MQHPRRLGEAFYCQPDGGQWNVKVEIASFDVALVYHVIYSPDLVGSFTDKFGNQYLIVASETLSDTPRNT